MIPYHLHAQFLHMGQRKFPYQMHSLSYLKQKLHNHQSLSYAKNQHHRNCAMYTYFRFVSTRLFALVRLCHLQSCRPMHMNFPSLITQPVPNYHRTHRMHNLTILHQICAAPGPWRLNYQILFPIPAHQIYQQIPILFHPHPFAYFAVPSTTTSATMPPEIK